MISSRKQRERLVDRAILCTICVIVGVILGQLWAAAQEANRADLCRRYDLYCERDRG